MTSGEGVTVATDGKKHHGLAAMLRSQMRNIAPFLTLICQPTLPSGAGGGKNPLYDVRVRQAALELLAHAVERRVSLGGDGRGQRGDRQADEVGRDRGARRRLGGHPDDGRRVRRPVGTLSTGVRSCWWTRWRMR